MADLKPKEFPITGRPTPEVLDELLIDTIDYNKPGFVRIPYGSPHQNVRDFPNHRLVLEKATDTFGVYNRFFANGYTNQDGYNYDISYTGESNSHPVFIRRYLERRDSYVPLTKESRLSGVYLIQVTNGGTGYTSVPTVTIAGGGGVGATATALVNSLGAVSWIYITSEGTGYTSTPSVNIGGPGIGAAATAILHKDVGVVSVVTVTNSGSGYTSAPSVTITGGSGSGATAVAQIDSAGKVRTVTVTAFGGNYTSAPLVGFSGGGGINAAASATIETARFALVKEDAKELPNDDPRQSLYLLVTRVYETLPGPVLTTHDYWDLIDDYIKTDKRLVLASTVPGDMHWVTRTDGQIVEYQPLSKYRSIQIASNINTAIAWENGGTDFTYKGTANYSFPNEIHTNPSIHVYFAISGTTLAIDFGWSCNVIEGYSGPCEATFIERYTFEPENAAFQAALPTVTVINPQSDVINDGFVYSGGNLIAHATQFVIPSTLHDILTIDVTGTAPPVNNLPGPVATIPATTPTSIPSGTEIVASVKPERLRFGLWVFRIVKVKKP